MGLIFKKLKRFLSTVGTHQSPPSYIVVHMNVSITEIG